MRSMALAAMVLVALPDVVEGCENGAAPRGCGFVGSLSVPLAGLAPRRQGAALRMSMGNLAGDFQPGDKVAVKSKAVLIMYHVKPKEYPDGYTVPQGLKGTVKSLANIEPKSGKEVSPNRPVLVTFEDPKFMAHFEAKELEKC